MLLENLEVNGLALEDWSLAPSSSLLSQTHEDPAENGEFGSHNYGSGPNFYSVVPYILFFETERPNFEVMTAFSSALFLKTKI